MTDLETIRRLQNMLGKKDDEIRGLRQQVSGTGRRLDKQRNELARMHQLVEQLKADKSNLLRDLKRALGPRA